ncbi:MAG: hypothetical protein WD294_03580 [Phycisphaeraceae bacterium]
MAYLQKIFASRMFQCVGVGTVLIAASFAFAAEKPCRELGDKQGPGIKKLGTIDLDMVETTPIVFDDRLYRFESVRPDYKGNEGDQPYFRFIDVETGEPTPAFADGHALGSAYTEDGTMYVFGVRGWGTSTIYVFSSDDLQTWESQPALELPGWTIYNTTVCKADGRYVMGIEIGDPPEVVGAGFTGRFAESKDLKDWTLMSDEHVFTKEHYSACPSIRYIDGMFYMTYLHPQPGYHFETHIVRSTNLIDWEASQLNPIMKCSPEDKQIANPNVTADEKDEISNALDRNNSDVDFCEFDGELVIYYSWGDQVGNEFLAEARYDGTLKQFFLDSFPASP